MMDLKETLYSNLQTISTEEYKGYLNEEELGFININKHPEDENIVILNYTEMATYEKRWNKYTMSARGLILDLTDVVNNGIIYVLAKGFEKFPNFGSNEIEGYEDDIDFNEVTSVMEKMDGSLGISYFFKGEIRFATRGSFKSEQALKATEIWRKKYAQHENLNVYVKAPVTYLVEIIYPDNRIVVDYKDKEELVMLGVIYLFCEPRFSDAYYEAVELEATTLKMPVASRYYFTIETLLEMKKSMTANEEGFVIRFSNGKRLKIKGEEYLKVHRVIHGLSDKAKVEAWSNDRMQEYIMVLPEEFRPELENLSNNLDKLKDALLGLLQVIYEVINEESTDQKSFALTVNKMVNQEFRHFIFDAKKNGVISVDRVKHYIYKNYDEYLKVVKTWNN